ncbi:MAG: zf-HC2 domain-containing protein [Spirochaetota bacterium]|nr:zf-HC2 domain-containing protein [Spirochaetota bacterium]
MKGEHISFNILSDLHDDTLSSEEKDAVMNHLKECPICNKEYDELKNLTRMLSDLKYLGMSSASKFTYKTVQRIRRVKRRDRLRRLAYTAAVAASIVFIAGMAFLYYDSLNTNYNSKELLTRNSDNYIDEDIDEENEYSYVKYSKYQNSRYKIINSKYGVGETLLILNNNRVKEISVFDSYIEGKVGISSFDRLRREVINNRLHNQQNRTDEYITEAGYVVEESPLPIDFRLLSGNDDDEDVGFRINCK